VSLLIVAIAVVVVTASAAIAQSSGPDAAQRAEREGKFAEAAEIWRVVAKVCGHVERAKSWLDTHGNDLHRYGVED